MTLNSSTRRNPHASRSNPKPSCHREFPNRPVMHPHPHRPFSTADFLEMERGVQSVLSPKLKSFARGSPDMAGQRPAMTPKVRRASTWKIQASFSKPASRGNAAPLAMESRTLRSTKSSFPESASALICLSHSSSACGRSSASNSQYSRGDSFAMASLISATVLMQGNETLGGYAVNGESPTGIANAAGPPGMMAIFMWSRSRPGIPRSPYWTGRNC